MKNALHGVMRAILLLTVSVLMFRCSDDDNDNPVKTSDLIQGSWQVTADVISPPIDLGSGPVSDLYAAMDACDKDDLYIIKANGIGEFNEGLTKCDPGDPQTAPFSWTLTNNDKSLVITEALGTLTFDIVQLNSTTLKMAIKENILGTEYVETITYARK